MRVCVFTHSVRTERRKKTVKCVLLLYDFIWVLPRPLRRILLPTPEISFYTRVLLPGVPVKPSAWRSTNNFTLCFYFLILIYWIRFRTFRSRCEVTMGGRKTNGTHGELPSTSNNKIIHCLNSVLPLFGLSCYKCGQCANCVWIVFWRSSTCRADWGETITINILCVYQFLFFLEDIYFVQIFFSLNQSNMQNMWATKIIFWLFHFSLLLRSISWQFRENQTLFLLPEKMPSHIIKTKLI